LARRKRADIEEYGIRPAWSNEPSSLSNRAVVGVAVPVAPEVFDLGENEAEVGSDPASNE